MLFFVGLGLFDELDISVRGLEVVRQADLVLAEFYTSRLMGSSAKRLSQLYGRPVTLLSRSDVEESPGWLSEARDKDVAFLVGGDPMISTTHLDLRLRAEEMGIPTRVIHSSTIASAVPGLTGLQNYRFGRSASIPFPYKARGKRIVPETPYMVFSENRRQNLHTLLYLDIQEDHFMTVNQGIECLLEVAVAGGETELGQALGVGVARAGSDGCMVRAGTLSQLVEIDFGPPLHILVMPGGLHFMEARALQVLAKASPELVRRFEI
ncbi:MAG: Diphthine synthase [Methanosaeta sp. PtaB.Bin039]|nr:MAG: Diphthine synthase [Methanosaeta sp. PtaB.Bin039]